MDKTQFYAQLAEQVKAIIASEPDTVANMANVSALLFEALEQVNWVGFYRCIDNELVLGPFQGRVACIRIPVGKGVCGTAVSENATQRIDNVHQFTGHITCDAASNAEIVIPVRLNNKVVGVLDIDSEAFERFELADQQGLENIVQVFEQALAAYNIEDL